MPACDICGKFPKMTDREKYIHEKYFHQANDSHFYGQKQCPDCGLPTITSEGCLKCSDPGCGWSKCG